MGYKWLPVTEDFDKTLVIKKWRYDVNNAISGNYDGALSELPNIDIKTCWNNSQPSNGYAFSNRFNLGTNYFCNRYYNLRDAYWTATTSSHTTLVSGTTYEFECPVDLYWAGNYTTPWNPNIPNMMWFYVLSSTFETDVTAITASYSSTTTEVTLTADEDMAWTASTQNDWITVSPVSGTGSTTLTISVSQNKTYISRTGSVEITNGEDTIEITVVQDNYPLIVPSENIYRGDLEVVKGYRSGSLVKKMYRNGELIYYRLNKEIHTTFEADGQEPIDYGDDPPEYIDF